MKNKHSKICILGLVLLAFSLLAVGCSNETDLETTSPSGVVDIPLSSITNEARWYEHESGGDKITFFVVKASDGSIKTGFDACDVCYTYGKGYRQEGDDMVCNNCGNRYPISGLGTENKNPGGCWPGYLSNTVNGDNITIKKSDLKSNSWRAL